MDIKDYPNYLIYENGEIHTKPRHRVKGGVLKQHLNSEGYYVVSLWKDRKRKLCRVHRLLAEHFIPNPENKRCIDHIDRNRQNNSLDNLRWATDKENCNNKNHDEYKVKKTNKLGIKNIHYCETNKYYKFKITRDKKQHVKYFQTLEEAIEYKSICLKMTD
jgi:hypothetical protein